ncbi:Bud site selection protein 6 [Ascosphaera atra]|nr:Bud site selection protein 6 [Ascosphaera atra]
MEPPLSGGPQTTPQLGSRTSSGSGRSSHRSLPHDRQVSQIEKSVGHLLVATKQLLETLTQWSRQQATETEVSDVYVRLGYEFNLACRAFQSIGVDTSDLGPVPDMLRTILEDTLSQEALPESLERYLPRIRDIIINLLQGLKRKQARIRSRQPPRELRAGPPRRESSGSVDVNDPASASAHPPDDAAFVSTSPPPPRSPEPGMRGAYPDVGAVRHASSGERFGGSFAEREASRRENPRWGANSPQSSMSNMASAVSAPTPGQEIASFGEAILGAG